MAFAAPFLVKIGINLLIGAALWGIGMLLRKSTHQEGPRVKDKNTHVSTYGTPKPILYGQTKPAMILIGADKLKEHKHVQEVGKGGGATATTYTYSCTWGGICGISPDPAVFGELLLLKLWADEKLVYNATGPIGQSHICVKASGEEKNYSRTRIVASLFSNSLTSQEKRHSMISK